MGGNSRKQDSGILRGDSKENDPEGDVESTPLGAMKRKINNFLKKRVIMNITRISFPLSGICSSTVRADGCYIRVT